MSKEAEYTPATWERIRRLPFMVSIGMEGSGRSGPAGSVAERKATITAILKARATYPENELIQAVLPISEEENGVDAALKRHDEAMDRLVSKGILTTEALQEHLEQCIAKALPEIESREGHDGLEQYKEWLLEIASSVALSAKEGDFLGIGGQRFSREEQAYYTTLKQMLYPDAQS